MVNIQPVNVRQPEPPKMEWYVSSGVCPTCQYHLERHSRALSMPSAVVAICPKCQNGMTVENYLLKGIVDK